MERTLIIILNWNGSEDTLACCQSLKLSKDEGFDIFLLDNNSSKKDYTNLKEGLISQSLSVVLSGNTDTSLHELCKEFITITLDEHSIYIARANTNYGFAKGCNIGADFAVKHNYKYVLFLNNDTLVEPGFLNLLLETLIIDRCDAVIPQIRYAYDKEKIWNCGGKINRFGNRTYFYANENVNNISFNSSKFDVSFATGCCLLFNSEYFVRIGKFTEKFFFGEEDIELGLRMLMLESRMVCDTRALIYHKVGASIVGDRERILRKAYIHYLNRFINMKYFLKWTWWPWLIPSLAKVFINVIKINKLTPKESLLFIKILFFDAYNNHSVSKDKFESILLNGYK